uniref:BI1-like protein n=1 Tax=Leersia perrieri TaxID=77586 RepID=A0A0D9WGB4_9ORYZ
MASSATAEMQPLAPAGYRRAPEMKEKVDASAVDLEAGNGETLYPGISRGESALRWGFVRKVYGILAAQLLLTTAVSALTVLHPTLNATLSSSPTLALVLAVLPFVLMVPLYHYQHKHPHNFVYLGLFTLCLSFSVGVACANTQGKIVLEALILTSAVVASLTAYTFWASKKGKEFGYLGPILFSALILLIVISFVQASYIHFIQYTHSNRNLTIEKLPIIITNSLWNAVLQMFFPLGSGSVALFGGLGALVFSGFIIYDTENLIKRHTYDDYIWASVELYLDILNLFLYILNMIRSMQSDN